jgi:hypothetical protein
MPMPNEVLQQCERARRAEVGRARAAAAAYPPAIADFLSRVGALSGGELVLFSAGLQLDRRAATLTKPRPGEPGSLRHARIAGAAGEGANWFEYWAEHISLELETLIGARGMNELCHAFRGKQGKKWIL